MSLAELLERVEKAEGPDREIDFDLERLVLEGDGWEREDGGPFSDPKWIRPDAFGRIFVYGVAPLRTASVDAALALIDRLLPGWRLRLQIEGDDTHEAWLENKGDFGAICAHDTQSFCASPALAIIAALLRALIARAASP